MERVAKDRAADRPAQGDPGPLRIVGDVGKHVGTPGDYARHSIAGRCDRGCSGGWRVIEATEPGGYSRTAPCSCLAVRQTATRLDAARMMAWSLRVRPEWVPGEGPTLAGAVQLAGRIGRGEPGRVWHGETGTGKSWRAAALALAAVDAGTTVRWVHWPSLMESLKWAIGKGGDMEAIRRPLEVCRLLIVDEVGQGDMTPFAQTQVDAIVGARAESGACICATTNMKPDDAREYLGDRTWSRLLTVATLSEVKGPSLRAAAK